MLGVDTPSLDSLVETYPFSSNKDHEQELLAFHTSEELAPMIEEQRERDKNRQKSRLDAGRITQEEYEAAIKRIETEIPDWYYRDIVHDQWWESVQRPWTAEEFPYLAHWIVTMDDWTLKLMDISRQYTGYYHPQMNHDEQVHVLYAIPLPYVQGLRETARFFQMRGNFEFARGNFDEAMECSFSTIRLARTIRGGACWIVE
jgi:hypothetical protein